MSRPAGAKKEKLLNSWPHLVLRELSLFLWVLAILTVLAILVDAPLRAPASADIPENPAKAPWYFLGLQELVSYSAFMGGLFLPFFSLFGLALIPYLDREPEGVGRWFGGPRDAVVTAVSAAFGLVVTSLVLAFTVRYGWLRTWQPTIEQGIIVLVNPGTVLTALYMAFSLGTYWRTRSTRAAAVALFTLFVVGFVVLTVMGTFLRGPNWEFYWSPSAWPAP
jgi:quinol-cytochrome oxidoreductase complex cytochrome b subunit